MSEPSDRIQRALQRAQGIAVARDTEERIATAMRVVRKNLDMVENESHIKLIALVRVTCLFLVTELAHLPFREVRRQSFTLFKKCLDELHVKLTVVQQMDEKANDQ